MKFLKMYRIQFIYSTLLPSFFFLLVSTFRKKTIMVLYGYAPQNSMFGILFLYCLSSQANILGSVICLSPILSHKRVMKPWTIHEWSQSCWNCQIWSTNSIKYGWSRGTYWSKNWFSMGDETFGSLFFLKSGIASCTNILTKALVAQMERASSYWNSKVAGSSPVESISLFNSCLCFAVTL